jgi:sigma54-dependent transcription regulator
MIRPVSLMWRPECRGRLRWRLWRYVICVCNIDRLISDEDALCKQTLYVDFTSVRI